MPAPDRVLVTGATGRTGRHVVAAAHARGLTPVALTRDPRTARSLLPGTEVAAGDLTEPGSLAEAVRGVGAVVFVHGSDDDPDPRAFERVDYGGVVNVLRALGDRRPRIVLQSTIFVTRHHHYFNEVGRALDWKRRAERLVRLSRAPYTIVRPGWLDTGEGGDRLRVEQGDTGDDGVDRGVLGSLLVQALFQDEAVGRTIEVYSGPGAATTDTGPLFASATPDVPGAADAVRDAPGLPLDTEPTRVRDDLARLARPAHG